MIEKVAIIIAAVWLLRCITVTTAAFLRMSAAFGIMATLYLAWAEHGDNEELSRVSTGISRQIAGDKE